MDAHERKLWELDNFKNAYRNWLMDTMDAWDYGVLFDILYETEFVWTVERDVNRAEDGKDLRIRFAEQSGLPLPGILKDWPCSFLEMLIGLAYSIEEDITYDPQYGDQTAAWFWVMMGNLHLDAMDDAMMFECGHVADAEVRDICETVMNRTYRADGYGGIFPLQDAPEDQRKVEICYQANAYCVEQME